MICFYSNERVDGAVRLSGEDAQHAVKSLRLRNGDNIVLVVDGRRFAASLELRGREVLAHPTVPLPDTEPRTRITLYQGLVKGDKMDDIVRRCTEVGVHAVVPCLFARSVARPTAAQMKPRLERWRRIAREAAMQSGRTVIPQVGDLVSFAAMLTALEKHRQALAPWEEATAVSLPQAYTGETDIAVVIGPEGGIDPEEITQMKATPVTLGPRVLRADTAGLAAVVALLAVAGDMSYGSAGD